MKKSILFLLIFFLSFFSQNGNSSDLSGSKVRAIIPQVDRFIVSYLKKLKAPGCVVAIVGPEEVYFLKAYGVKKFGQTDLLTPNTVFQLASLSKTISATLAVKLYYQGRLSLSDPVSKYLPSFKLKGTQHPLRLRHILSHTSGLSSLGANALIERCMPREVLFIRAQSQKVSTQPGEWFDYHNTMYGLVEDILVAATHQPFRDLVHDNIFKPLGMKKASVGYQAMITSKDRAYPHDMANKSKILRPSQKYSKCYYSVLASAGMNGSMLDLIPFLQAQLGGRPEVLSAQELEILHTPQIKAPETLKKMQEKYSHISNSGYALGWRWMDYAGEKVIYHGGWVNGSRPMIAFLPKYKVGIVILHHAETPLSFRTTIKFINSFLDLKSEDQIAQSVKKNKTFR
jgi:beta-lactamase class C